MNKIEAILKIQKELVVEDKFTHLDIPSSTLLDLYRKGLLAHFLDDRQNDSPTIKEFIEVAEKYHNAKFISYVVNTDRDDTRLSIEGFSINDLDTDNKRKLASKFINADELDLNDGNFRVWWD